MLKLNGFSSEEKKSNSILGEPWSISKIALFQHWTNFMKKIQSNSIPTIYHDAKQLAVVVDYQMAKFAVEFSYVSLG